MNPKLKLGLQITAGVLSGLGLLGGGALVQKSYAPLGAPAPQELRVKVDPCICKVILPDFNVTKRKFEEK